MGKILYETTLLVCSSCVIFTGTVSAVLLMLAWPNDRILGLSTRMVIGLCLVIVAIFSVGFVGTIAESIRALLVYACLLILFPVSVLLVEIILRVCSTTPTAVPVPTISLSTAAPVTPKSTLIFSNSFTSNSASDAPLPASSSASLEQNFSLNSIFVSPSPPLSALLPLPSLVHLTNLSIHPQLPLSSTPIPTDFYLLFKDGYLDTGHSESSRQMPSVGQNDTDHSNTAPSTGQTNPRSTFLKATHNFWSDILTTSLSPRVETLVEYVLIGMLGFVLLQIGIAYLLASEIRTLRSELAMLASMTFHKSCSDPDEEEESNLVADQAQTNLAKFDKAPVEYCELQCFDSLHSQLPLTYPANSADCSANFASSDFCLLTFQPQPVMPLVQVHANPDPTPTVAAVPATDPVSSPFNSNYVNVIIDETLANKPTQFASSMSSSTLTSRTNRRNRVGSFRVTFDSAPEYFESSTEPFGKTGEASSTLDGTSHCLQKQQSEQQHYQS